MTAARAILDALSAPAVAVDNAGKVVAANAAFARLAGSPGGEVVGRRLDRFAPAAVSGPAVQADAFVLRPDGARVPVVASAGPRADYADVGRARVVTFADVSGPRGAVDDARGALADARASVADLKAQYRAIAEVSDTFLHSAQDLSDHNHDLEAAVAARTAELASANAELHAANLDAVYMLAVASEAKDEQTGRHVLRLRDASAALARALGFSESDAAGVGTAAVLHDVGKLHVPDGILQKPGPLTDAERDTMRSHTTAGERILADRPFFARARRVARSHHENHDGTGYPDGLSGDAVPVEARIVHLADVYDALTHARVYKPAWPAARARAVIAEQSGRMFDPEVVRAFGAVSPAGRGGIRSGDDHSPDRACR